MQLAESKNFCSFPFFQNVDSELRLGMIGRYIDVCMIYLRDLVVAQSGRCDFYSMSRASQVMMLTLAITHCSTIIT